MKALRCLFVTLLVSALAGIAQAEPIDFHMGVLDPPPQLNFTLIDGTAPFAVDFGACPANIAALGYQGCFTGYNDTPSTTFTALSLIFENTTSDDPSDQTNYLNGQTPTCDTNVPLSVFGGSNCALSPDGSIYTLDFFGGEGIAPGQFFFIVESGPVPSAFGTGIGEVSSVPEPETLSLLSTGMAMFGLAFARRRAARISES